MRRLVSQCLRVACLAYIGVLWLAVIPTKILPYNPTLTVTHAQAQSALSSIGLSAGDAIFTGSPSEWKIAANCLSVMGETARGARRALYANECPNRAGFRLRNAPLDQTFQEMTRRTIKPPIKADSAVAERLRDISDYFCHSTLVERPPLARVILKQTVYVRSAWSGNTLRNPTMRCTMSCAIAIPGAPLAPQCEPRGVVKRVGVKVDVK